MTALTVYNRNMHHPAYGAAELKEIIQRNTYKSFLLTLSAILAVGILSMLVGAKSILTNNGYAPPPIEIGDYFGPIDDPIDIPKLPEVNYDQVRTEYVAGIPEPVTADKDILIEFSDVTKIDVSLSGTEGKVINPEDVINYVQQEKPIIQEITKTESLPDIESVPDVEKYPEVDLESIQKNVVYPQMAINIGLEGTVVIRVLIDANGKPARTSVFNSDSPMLEKAATAAVLKATFTPAIQNGKAVACWVNIPIRFKLR